MSPRRRSTRRRAIPQLPSAATWIAARARNALRRPLFISTVSILTFATSLLALIIVPQQARKTALAISPPSASRPDTEPTAGALREAERQVLVADSLLVQTRLELTQLVAATAAASNTDTANGGGRPGPDTRSRRDTLASHVELLGRLIARSENAPLLGSYRALAQAAPMQGDPRVKLALDSLVEIDRERESYSALGGVDPVFVALTARANELGRSIEALAVARRTALRTEIAALAPPPPVVPAAIAARPFPDTLARIKERDDARTAAAGVASRLARERTELMQLDAREERAKDLLLVNPSPSAMLAAALVFGAVLGFGFALLAEVRRPRVADASEAERATGIRVLGVIHPLPKSPERGRREADRAGPQYIDPGGDGHQLVYLTIATVGSNTVMITVTGDSPTIASVVAVNFAAIAADEARSTILVDTDSAASSVIAALRMRGSAGMSGIVNEGMEWADVRRTARLGRDRTVDVVPSGTGALPSEAVSEIFQRESARLVKRYDAIVVVSSPEQVVAGVTSALPVPDVLYCARAGQTTIADLQHAVAQIEETGANVRGIVLWNAPPPVLSSLRPSDEVELESVAAA